MTNPKPYGNMVISKPAGLEKVVITGGNPLSVTYQFEKQWVCISGETEKVKACNAVQGPTTLGNFVEKDVNVPKKQGAGDWTFQAFPYYGKANNVCRAYVAAGKSVSIPMSETLTAVDSAVASVQRCNSDGTTLATNSAGNEAATTAAVSASGVLMSASVGSSLAPGNYRATFSKNSVQDASKNVNCAITNPSVDFTVPASRTSVSAWSGAAKISTSDLFVVKLSGENAQFDRKNLGTLGKLNSNSISVKCGKTAGGSLTSLFSANAARNVKWNGVGTTSSPAFGEGGETFQFYDKTTKTRTFVMSMKTALANIAANQ